MCERGVGSGEGVRAEPSRPGWEDGRLTAHSAGVTGGQGRAHPVRDLGGGGRGLIIHLFLMDTLHVHVHVIIVMYTNFLVIPGSVVIYPDTHTYCTHTHVYTLETLSHSC